MKLSAARLIPWAGACCIALAASWIAQPLFFAPEQPVSTSIALNEPQPPQAGNSQKPVDRPAPAPLSQRIVEYHIGAALEAGTKTIQGQQTMTWTNPGAQPVGELYFHLYPNAFKSKDSTFMQESGGKLRKDRMKEGSYGQMDILSMKTAQGESLKDRIEYVQPDDGNKKKDTTLIKLTLPNPVNPGEKKSLCIPILQSSSLPFLRGWGIRAILSWQASGSPKSPSTKRKALADGRQKVGISTSTTAIRNFMRILASIT